MRWVMLAVILGGLMACGQASRTMRAHTYPQSFDYITREDVHDSMLQLALRVQRLDTLLRTEDEAPEDARRTQAAALLAEMEATTQRVSRGGTISNHPEFAARLSHFSNDLRAAREAVESEPADYFLAGAVVGSCAYCHR